jgi:hypothetical protein
MAMATSDERPANGTTEASADASGSADLGDRAKAFGTEAQAAGERFGREAQAAGERLSVEARELGERMRNDPTWAGAGDAASRAWGLIILAIGLWFFLDVTLGYSLPSLPWRDIWPAALILIGGAVVVRGLARRA